MVRGRRLPMLALVRHRQHKPRVLERRALLTPHGSKPLQVKRRWEPPRALVRVLQKLPELALVVRHSRLEQIPQPLFKRLALAYKGPVRPLAKPVLVALRLPNNLQDKPET